MAAVKSEYDAARGPGAWCDRSHRALLEIRGKDRAAWLHNLCTNQVKPLQAGDGNYAFFLNVKGRILFDANLLVQPDTILLDLDRRALPTALAHLNKFIIMEEVTITDHSAEWRQIGLIGRAVPIMGALWGFSNAETMADLQSVSISPSPSQVADSPWRGEGRGEGSRDQNLLLFRHDFCGLPGLQIAGPSDTVAALGQQLESTAASTGLRAIGFDAVEALRIEAGIPVYPHEINEDVLPAETGQLERAVSFQKGCYLGQEVVERMRAHKSLGKQLVGLRLESQAPPGSPITIAAPSQSEREEEGRGGGASPSPSKGEGRGEGTVIGKLTSVCRSPALDAMIGLAYIRVAHSAPGTQVQMTPQDAAPITARVTPLPFPHP